MMKALKDVKDGDWLAMGGFGIVGIPENGVLTLIDQGVVDVNIVSNIAGIADWGIGLMLQKKQVKSMNASYVGENPVYENQYLTGQIELNLIPQGTLVEKVRCGAAGIPAFYVKAGVGTVVEEGGFPVRLTPDGKGIVKVSRPKERRNFEGTEYLLEEAITVDFAMIKAYQADHKGNLRFRKTARNFNPDMCGCGKITIVETEHIVDELPPEQIHFPGCFVDRIYQAEKVYGKIERLRVSSGKGFTMPYDEKRGGKRMRIVRRAIKELKDGYYCNLGVGIPSFTANFAIGNVDCELQSENGLVGIGPYPQEHEVDCDLINAGKETVTALEGHSYTRSSETFGMMRGKHLHMTMLGGLQVAQNGDLANWIIPGQIVKGMGGAMDLVSSGARVIVAMEHCSTGGVTKVLKKCQLPLTGKGVVTRLITDLGVFEFSKQEGMVLLEIAEGVTVEELRNNTEAEFKVSPNLKPMEQAL